MTETTPATSSDAATRSPASDDRGAGDQAISDPKAIAVRSIHAMAAGSRADFDAVYHPACVDHENSAQPPASRVPGPAGCYATALWLRAAFAGLRYDIHHVVAD